MQQTQAGDNLKTTLDEERKARQADKKLLSAEPEEFLAEEGNKHLPGTRFYTRLGSARIEGFFHKGAVPLCDPGRMLFCPVWKAVRPRRFGSSGTKDLRAASEGFTHAEKARAMPAASLPRPWTGSGSRRQFLKNIRILDNSYTRFPSCDKMICDSGWLDDPSGSLMSQKSG